MSEGSQATTGPRESDEIFENPEGQQLELPALAQDAALLEAKERYEAAKANPSELQRYPLTTLEKDARRVDEILRVLASGMSLISIQKLCGIGYHSLKALESKYLGEIAERKKRIARKLEFAAEQQVDRLIENPESLKLESAAVTAGILLDKALIVRGDANSITKQLGGDEPTAEDFAAYVDALPAASPADPAAMGSGAAGVAGKKGGERLEGDFEGGTDGQSVERVCKPLNINDDEE